jgi:hypothetical protein
MSMRDLIRRVLAIFLTAGLIAALLVSPTAAKPVHSSTMAVSGMTDGMPCCPDEPKSGWCPDCPLIAMCMFKVALDRPSAGETVPDRVPGKTAHRVYDDKPARKVDRPPPDHPPRTSI